MSIMDLFRAPAAAPMAAKSAQLDAGATPETPGAGTPSGTSTTTAATQTPGEPKSPLDAYQELWKIDDKQAPAEEPLFNVDPAKLHEAAAQTDFTKVITPELRQKLAAGGEEAIAANLEVMNKIAQANFAHSALATTKIVEQVVDKLAAKHEAQIAAMLKQSKISDNLTQENPLLDNPAVAPLVKAMKDQFTAKYPNASPAEISTMTKDYFKQVATVFSPAQPTNSAQEGTPAYDWSNFLNS